MHAHQCACVQKTATHRSWLLPTPIHIWVHGVLGTSSRKEVTTCIDMCFTQFIKLSGASSQCNMCFVAMSLFTLQCWCSMSICWLMPSIVANLSNNLWLLVSKFWAISMTNLCAQTTSWHTFTSCHQVWCRCFQLLLKCCQGICM